MKFNILNLFYFQLKKQDTIFCSGCRGSIQLKPVTNPQHERGPWTSE